MDKKKKIELEVLNISNSQEQAGAYALVLGEVDGARQLPVIIGAAEAQAMLISLKGIVPPRPLTHNLFASCLEVLGVNMMRALIYRVDNGVFCEDGVIYEAADGSVTPIMETKDILLPGVHNIENYMAAFAAVRGQVRYETMREIAKTFGGVEHRIELIRTRNGVRWYNDSIASSPSRTIAGLNSFPEKVILIAGGKDKGISYAPLGPVVNDHVKLLLLCGKTAGVIREAVEQAENYKGLEILDVADYHEAVSIADARSQPGDVVILSPASTSYDRFANFMERGQVFKAIVNELK